MTAPAGAITRDQVLASARVAIRANGQQLITGPLLEMVLEQVVDSVLFATDNLTDVADPVTAAATLGLLQSGGVALFSTLAELNASLNYPDATKGEVWLDPIVANNGVYRKSGASGSGTWVFYGSLYQSALFYNVLTKTLQTTDWSIGESQNSSLAIRSQTSGLYAADFTTVREAQTDFFSPEDYKRMNAEANALTNQMKSIRRHGLAVYGEGFNLALGVGQSFRGGAVTNGKILTTAARNSALGILYSALMVGLSERPMASNPGAFDYYGGGSPAPFNSLVATCTNDGTTTLVDPTTAFPITVRGETPFPTELITFEYLWRQARHIGGLDTTRRDVAMNFATTGSSLAQISTDPAAPLLSYATLTALNADLAHADGTLAQVWNDSPTNNGTYTKSGASGSGSWARTGNTVPYPRTILLNGFDVFNAAVNGVDPTAGRRLSVVCEDHGQADNALQTATADYMSGHRAFRSDVFNNMAVPKLGQKLTPLWVGHQVAGRYSNANRFTSQAQLNMSLADNDYVLAGPDYGWTNFVNALPNPGDPHIAPRPGDHPYWLNRHPSANASRVRGTTKAIARYFIQVLRQNWFPLHIAKAYYRGSKIIALCRAMQTPLRIVPTLLGFNFLDYLPWRGFDVEDNTVVVPIISVSLPAGTDLLIEIDCGQMLGSVTAPILGTCSNILGTIDGSTNIRDSFTLWSLFKYIFEAGYMDVNLSTPPFTDTLQQENIASLLGTLDLGNWMSAQRVTCEPLPSSYYAGATP